MKNTRVVTLLLALSMPALAADIEAGKAKVAQVCAACHGANGVSVSEAIPNLAAQRARYIEAQLKALKAGTRKNDIMNAMAAQLSPEEIANVAAYFASLPGAGPAAKSDLMPQVAKTRVALPADYPKGFVRYHAMNLANGKQVDYFLANAMAVDAAKSGKPLPDGAILVSEVHAARLGADGKAVMGADGLLVPEKVVAYAVMARGAGWGKDIPEMLRNGDWNYAVLSPEKQSLAGVNQAECLACHKPQDKTGYVFTSRELASAK